MFRGNTKYFKMFSPEKLYRKYIKDDYDILVAYLEGSCTRIISGCPDKNKVKITWRHFAENEKEFLQAYRSMDEAKKIYQRFEVIQTQIIIECLESAKEITSLDEEVFNTLVDSIEVGTLDIQFTLKNDLKLKVERKQF